MSIIIFIIVLAVLILSHEFGHFIVAKRAGVRVDEFGLGFPPRLLGWKRGETTYSFNLLPFGGFVKIFGENPDEESEHGVDAKRSLTHQPKHIQAVVLVAGVVFNLILAWLFLSAGLMAGLPVAAGQVGSATGPHHLLITTVRPSSPAALVGLTTGDEIISLQDEKKLAPENLTSKTVAEFISAHAGQTLNLIIKHGNTGPEHKLAVKPVTGLIPDKVAIGIAMDEVVLAKLGPIAALVAGAQLTANLTVATVDGLIGLITGAFAGKPVLGEITGPVGLAGLVGDAAHLGFVYLLSFTAFISINLAVLNLLPFPALDGGRLLFLLIEKLKGSPIKPQIANTLNLAGFGLLLLLMAVVTYGDIHRLLFK